jgi:uncharacterized protein with PIN domain
MEKRLVLGGDGEDSGQLRFLADAMLGGLARWLRVLGYDTELAVEGADGVLVRQAATEGRFLLTRDRGLPQEWRVEGLILVDSDRPLEQLREVVAAKGLKGPWALFTRCTRCNALLERVDPGEVVSTVPPRVLERTREFVRCPTCLRVYWEGSHTHRMRSVLKEVLRRA